MDYETPIENDADLVRLDRDMYTPADSTGSYAYQSSPSPNQQKVYARAVERKTLFVYKDGMPLADENRMVESGNTYMSVYSCSLQYIRTRYYTVEPH